MKFDKAYFRDTHHKRRKLIIDYLGGKCVLCGSKEDLETDHIDPSTKLFNINKRMSLKNNKAEIDKCQLLCSDCHIEKTISEKSYTHGTLYAWQRVKCGCQVCIEAKWAWHDKRNAKRRKGNARGPYKTRRL